MSPDSHNIAVALFVRHPVPGRVKTRLARDLGAEPACELYRAMVADCISAVRASGMPLSLFHDGQDEHGLPLDWIAAAERIFRQQGDSLGERMGTAFEQSFSAGSAGVILVGSDIPGIDAGLLRSAADAMQCHDAVFSPAMDGGYCLVASEKNRFNQGIFREIPWSTSHVLEMTLAFCAARGLSYQLLEPRRDIDTLNDIKEYCRRPSPHALSTNAWLAANGYLPPVCVV
jgi:rSAM/selenodomain-associated transferase 1